jgi:ADP-ribose pyrophosphatase YjhB (NUDIX family)
MSLTAFPTKVLKVRTSVVLVHPEKGILLMRQNGKPFWVFPGGTLEEGETVQFCAEREMLEETGLVLTCPQLLYVSDFIDARRQVVEVFFIGNYVSGDLTFSPPHPENIDEIAWISLEQFAKLDVKPEAIHAKVLADWHEGLFSGCFPHTLESVHYDPLPRIGCYV